MQDRFSWDGYSDQPHIIKDRHFKMQMKKRYLSQYIKMIFASVLILPIATALMKLFRAKKNLEIGLCVNLDKGLEQVALIEELGVKHLLIRVPLWDMSHISEYVSFAKSFGDDKKIVIAVLQDREHIEDLNLFRDAIEKIFVAFEKICDEFQIGNAINRTKWGFFAMSEYLDFYQVAQDMRDEKYPDIKLIGPSVIDFEYYYFVPTLFTRRNITFDKLSSLLYVDRRGAPTNRQYGLFDTKNKIDLLYALARMGPKTTDGIYITEVNWPLSNTAPYAPTGEAECVSEELYARYMIEYFKIAKKNRKIEKVFWHQLIAPGYGLVDNRDGTARKTKAFYEFKQYLEGR